MSADHGQQQANEQERHERTLLALAHARDGKATDEDLSLLAWHAGVDYQQEIEHVARHGRR